MQQRPCEAAGDRHVKLSVQPHQTQATHSWQQTCADTLQRTFIYHNQRENKVRVPTLLRVLPRMGGMAVLYSDGGRKGPIDRPVNTGAAICQLFINSRCGA
jgi:hypothetical protein